MGSGRARGARPQRRDRVPDRAARRAVDRPRRHRRARLGRRRRKQGCLYVAPASGAGSGQSDLARRAATARARGRVEGSPGHGALEGLRRAVSALRAARPRLRVSPRHEQRSESPLRDHLRSAEPGSPHARPSSRPAEPPALQVGRRRVRRRRLPRLPPGLRVPGAEAPHGRHVDAGDAAGDREPGDHDEPPDLLRRQRRPVRVRALRPPDQAARALHDLRRHRERRPRAHLLRRAALALPHALGRRPWLELELLAPRASAARPRDRDREPAARGPAPPGDDAAARDRLGRYAGDQPAGGTDALGHRDPPRTLGRDGHDPRAPDLGSNRPQAPERAGRHGARGADPEPTWMAGASWSCASRSRRAELLGPPRSSRLHSEVTRRWRFR